MSFTFAPLTPVARTWLDEHVHIEPWQWLGTAYFVVDHRFAQPLTDGAIAAGLEVR